MDSRTMPAIDVHSHFNHGNPYDSEHTEVYNAYIDKLEPLNKAANVEKMLCSTFASVLHCEPVVEENEYLFELTRHYDWMYQWVVIEPRIEETFEQAKRMLRKGKCVGIKLHPPCHGYTLEEYGDKIFSFASDYGAVVEIHPEQPSTYILPFADRYPDVKFIMAHLANKSYVDAIEQAKNRNVYTDTSGSASALNYVVEYAVERVGSDRILYGSDTYSIGFQRGRIEYALISEQDKQNILRLNAERLFGDLIK